MGSICRAASLHVCATRTTVAVAPGNPPNGDGQRWLAARLCCRGHTHHRAEFGLFGAPAPFLLPLPPQLLLQPKWAVWGNAEADWITDKYFTPNCLSLVRARGRQGVREREGGKGAAISQSNTYYGFITVQLCRQCDEVKDAVASSWRCQHITHTPRWAGQRQRERDRGRERECEWKAGTETERPSSLAINQ